MNLVLHTHFCDMQVVAMKSLPQGERMKEHEAIVAIRDKCARQATADRLYMKGVKSYTSNWKTQVLTGELYHKYPDHEIDDDCPNQY